jgi:O-antigen ligase
VGLLVALPVLAMALGFGGGPGDQMLLPIGAAALFGSVMALPSIVSDRSRMWSFLWLVLLGVWSALSVSWSSMPDRSWVYANRGFVYVAAMTLGLSIAGRRREFAVGLSWLLGAVIVWSLLGKVIPSVYDYGATETGRLRGPVGLWNQLALVADFGLALALWQPRRRATLLTYVAVAALGLTFSRGGLIVGAIVITAWLLREDGRPAVARVVGAALCSACAVDGVAFVGLPGVTGSHESIAVRWRDGLIFGGLLVVGALVSLLLEQRFTKRTLVGLRKVRVSRSAAAVMVAIAAAGVAVIILNAGTTAVGNGPGRITQTSSNLRFTWWSQAVSAWRHAKVTGTGAGSFHVTNLRYRTSFVDYATEPHSLPLQLLSELGVVGLLLFVAFVFTSACVIRRAVSAGQPSDFALALVPLAFLLHSLVDIDWDFVAVSLPAFVCLGALVGVRTTHRVGFLAWYAAAGAAVLVAASLVLPWLGARWSSEAAQSIGVSQSRVDRYARRARQVDPFLIEPLWWQAFETTDQLRALALYRRATEVQPQNAQAWLYKARLELENGCARAALVDFYRFNSLDRAARPQDGPNDYRRALRLVDSGVPRC